MPWFMTAYMADGTPPPDDLIGAYGGYLWANDLRHAKRVAKRRGLNERVEGEMTKNPRRRVYTLPSQWLAKRKPRDADVMHALCWLGHMALKSGAATADELLGDEGLIHEFVHMRSGLSGRRKKLIAMAAKFEARIPGMLAPQSIRALRPKERETV